MVTRRSVLTGALALSAAPYFGSLARAATPASTLVIAKQIDDIATGFDPAEVFEITNAEVNGNIYRTLVTADPSDPTKLIGDLAQSWTTSPDGRSMTFHLKQGVLFESGNPLSAKDVAFSLQRVVKLNKAVAFYLTQFGWTPANVESMVAATDAHTVTLSFPSTQAVGIVLACLADTCGGVVEQGVAMAKQVNGDLGNAWLRTHSAGSGAYSLAEWRASERIVLNANPHSAIRANVPRIVIRHVADGSTQQMLAKKGDVDIARNLGSDQLKALQDAKDVSIVHSNAFVQMYIGMNMDVPEFRNAQVRQAIKYAIDYDAIARNITPNAWYVSQSFLPQGMAGSVKGPVFTHDPDKAKALLEKAGLKGMTVTLDHYASWPYLDIAQAIQANLGALGIKVNLQAGEMSQVASRVRARQHQMTLGLVASSYLDPSENAAQFCVNLDDSANSQVKTFAWRQHYFDRDLSTAVERAAREQDTAKRLQLYAALQKRWFEDSPFVMLLQQLDSTVVRSGVQGFVAAPLPNFTSYAKVRKS